MQTKSLFVGFVFCITQEWTDIFSKGQEDVRSAKLFSIRKLL